MSCRLIGLWGILPIRESKMWKKRSIEGERFKEMAKECGVNIRELLWLMGDYDVFSIVDADSKESIMGLLLRASSKRFIKTTKFRAFHRGEIEGALKHVDYRDLELANESSG